MRGCITRNNNLGNEMENDSSPRRRAINYEGELREKIAQLEHEMGAIKDKRQDHTLSTDAGIANKIRGGLDELETVFDKGNKDRSNLPRNELHFAALRAIESRRKGCLYHK